MKSNIYVSPTKEWNIPLRWLLLGTTAFAVVCFLFFQLTCPSHFFFKGQNQLFLMSWTYAETLMAKPAWAACLAGEFLTQFYYYDYAGALILTATLTALLCITYIAVQAVYSNQWVALTVALVVTLREASCHLYFGYTLSSTYALLGGLLLFVALRGLLQRRWPWALAVVLLGTLSGYWLFGYGVWAFLLLSAVAVWRVALPVGVAFAALLPLMRSHYNLTMKGLCEYPEIGSLHALPYDMEKDLHIMHSYEAGDWDDVVKTAEADPLLNRLKGGDDMQVLMSDAERVSSSVRLFFYNLVQTQRGNLPDVLLNYYPNYLGTFTNMTAQKIPMMLFMNLHEFYYAIGDISYAERGAFLSCVCVPGNKNAYDIKRLAECALVKNEQEPARKYLALLRQTIPYRQWAEHAPQDERYQQQAQYINQQDSVSPNDSSHRIMTQLLRSNPTNEVAQDYMLCSLLLVKEIENFKRDYDLFSTERARHKRLYQEAMCIWLINHSATEEEWAQYIQDEEVLRQLNEYMIEKNERGGAPSLRFSHTYWYYYDVYNFEAY